MLTIDQSKNSSRASVIHFFVVTGPKATPAGAG